MADPFALPDDFGVEAARLARRRKLAETMIEQSMSPLQTESAGRFMVAPSPLQGIAKLFQAYSGYKQQQDADQSSLDLAERQRNMTASEISRYMARKNGVPASSEQIVDEQANGGEGAPATINAPAVGADPRAAVMEAMVSRNPMLQKLAGLDYAQMAKASEPYTLAPGAVRVVGGAKVADNPKPQEGFTLAPGATRYGPDGKILVISPKDDELARALEAAGVDPKSPEAVAFFKARAEKIATHAPPTRVNVNQSLTTEKKYGEQFASNIAKADSEMRDAAIKAPALAERANLVKKILADGNVITGFGADFRLSADKALALAGVKGADGSAANTETLASGLAQNTLDAIKASGLGSGNGFSNADRDFLEKAVGGKITLEKTTIDRLANLAHRAAEQTAMRWSTRVKEIPASALEGTGIKAEPVAVPPLFGASKAAPGGFKVLGKE